MLAEAAWAAPVLRVGRVGARCCGLARGRLFLRFFEDLVEQSAVVEMNGLRARPATAHIPIIMLTARTSESDRVTGLDVGADDYIVKPFSLRELTARVRAMLRRGNTDTTRKESSLVYRGKHLIADFDAVAVSVDGTHIRLTRREFELLRYLVENRNRVLSRDRLLERVWGYERFVETRSVDVHVGRLRAKLGNAGRQIETVVGLGYRFVE